MARAIQLGVQEGALGLAELKDGKPVPESLRFNAPLALDAIDFSPDQVVLTRERVGGRRGCAARGGAAGCRAASHGGDQRNGGAGR